MAFVLFWHGESKILASKFMLYVIICQQYIVSLASSLNTTHLVFEMLLSCVQGRSKNETIEMQNTRLLNKIRVKKALTLFG